MSAHQYVLPIEDELVVDEFSCGGGMSEGIEMAIGRPVDIAVNHNDDACSMHAANHPQTEHHCADVFDVCPVKVTRGRPVGLLHMSPDCTDHSQAKGGQPRSRVLRGLSWIGVRWAGQKRPRIITLENVKQILQWGPLIAKRCKKTGRVIRLDGTVAAPGERVPVELQYLVPDPNQKGRTWSRFVAILRSMGYVVEWRVLCAADHGAATSRNRLFMVARCDGEPIEWPDPSYWKLPKRGQRKWNPIHEHIDWTIPSKSIFDRAKPLADATQRRIAHGLKRYVLDSGDPFIVPIANWSRESVDSVRDPLRTVTAWPRGGSMSLVAPSLVQIGYGERSGQAPRALDLGKPLGTIVAGSVKHGLVAAFIEQANGGFNKTPGHDAREPASSFTHSGSQQRPVTAHLLHLRGNCDARDMNDPLQTVSAGGQHHGVVEYTLSPEVEEGALRCAAFLIKYYGEGGQHGELSDPLATVTTKDRLALVTVWIKGDPYVVVDICLRMLAPRELYSASSFRKDYIIDRGHDGRIFSKATQVEMCGNAVPPLLGKAVIQANYRPRGQMARAA